MGQLTISRFRGDTTFGLVARIISTFLGGLTGTVMWYISTGNGRGNSYGLAVVCAVTFPFFFYARLYWPGPIMINLLFWITTFLVRDAALQREMDTDRGRAGYWILVAGHAFYQRCLFVLRNQPRLGE